MLYVVPAKEHSYSGLALAVALVGLAPGQREVITYFNRLFGVKTSRVWFSTLRIPGDPAFVLVY